MNSLYDKMKFWLTDYVHKEELDGVAAMCAHIASRHGKTSFAIGLVLGLFAGVIVVRWIA